MWVCVANDFTIVAYMGLYCDRQGERNAIQSILSVGSLIGLLVMNYLADLKGRKKAFIINLVVGFLGMVRTQCSIQSLWWVPTPKAQPS